MVNKNNAQQIVNFLTSFVWPLLISLVCVIVAIDHPEPGFISFIQPRHVQAVVFAFAALFSFMTIFNKRFRWLALVLVSISFWGRAVAVMIYGVPFFSFSRNFIVALNWVSLFLANAIIFIIALHRGHNEPNN